MLCEWRGDNAFLNFPLSMGCLENLMKQAWMAIFLALLASTSHALTTLRENAVMQLSRISLVAYGSGGKYAIKQLLPGTYKCSNGLFGDPVKGVPKQCRIVQIAVAECVPMSMGGQGKGVDGSLDTEGVYAQIVGNCT